MSINQDDLQQTHEAALLQEITHVPLWVKGIVAAGIMLSFTQLFNFKASLNDAVKNEKAITAYNSGNFIEAIDLYTDLTEHYPNDIKLLKFLGLAHYKANHYYQAISTFQLLEGKQMLTEDVNQINAAIADIESKLKKVEETS